jgi:hypothetical protein
MTNTPATGMDQHTPAPPAWDSNDRTAHRTPIRSNSAAVAAHLHLPPRQGYFASHLQVTPDELTVDSYTNTIAPWLAVHPKVGRPILNFPVTLDVTIMDPELFFTGFKDQYRNDQLKYFLREFPKYSTHDTFYDYHEAVVRYCMVFGCFVTPLHTLRPNQMLGIWFMHPHLPHSVCNAAQTLSPTLAMALNSSHSGLTTDLRFQPFLKGGNGHAILLNLATVAGHPLLLAQGTTPADPRQRADQTLIVYLQTWNQHLKQHLLVGTIYSDRHYIDKVMTSMHSTLRAQFDSEIADQKNMSPYGEPLPNSLQPGSLLTTLHSRAAELGRPKCVTMTPRELRDATQPVHTVDELVRALNTARTCSLCQDPNHFIRDCPFQSKLADPNICKLLGMPVMKTTPAKSAPFKVRQLTGDHTVNSDAELDYSNNLALTSEPDFL